MERRNPLVEKLRENSFIHSDRVDLEEANETVQDAVGAKFIELQQI